MICPKCHGNMEKVTFEGVEVDRCVSCKGIWFDTLEAKRLSQMKGSDVIDVGDPVVGKKMNEVEEIECPKCHVPMIRLVDVDQHHIWYEACKQCQGVYFDAGEFKDYKHYTIVDFVRGLFAKERK